MTPAEINPACSNLVKCFITRELVRWPSIETIYGPTLRKTRVFLEKEEDGDRRWEDLHTRVIEHVSHPWSNTFFFELLRCTLRLERPRHLSLLLPYHPPSLDQSPRPITQSNRGDPLPTRC